MQQHEKCELLGDAIKAIISRGIDLSDDVVHYIDSTFANPTIDELQAILGEDSDCEGDTLMDLLFFPDESCQIRLEETLERCRPQKEDEDKLVTYLCREPLHATFRFKDGRGPLRLQMPADMIRPFVTRLRICKHLDAGLIESIRSYGDEQNIHRFKVKIRNSRFSASDSKTEFLGRFFEKIGAGSNDILECLDFILGFLDEIKADDDLYPALMAKKKFYFISLQKAQKMEARIEKHNIETLLLQGERLVLIDQADARKKMQLIDRISRAVFGQTRYFEQPVGDETQIEVGSPEDIKSIVKNFTR
ncbi:MAG: hypothetical protein JRF38_18855 [Deltaproteobacteria bacterium]|jgi:hypothetical protein|nr:hypothetical protein [Deltaproteobacteria bacterium]